LPAVVEHGALGGPGVRVSEDVGERLRQAEAGEGRGVFALGQVFPMSKA
jgi:hypothetical protein